MSKKMSYNSAWVGFFLGFALFAALNSTFNNSNFDLEAMSTAVKSMYASTTTTPTNSSNFGSITSLDLSNPQCPNITSCPTIPTPTTPPNNSGGYGEEGKEREREQSDDGNGSESRWALLLSMWDDFIVNGGILSNGATMFPRPPYWQNCSEKAAHNKMLDSWGADGSLPPWSLWKGNLQDVEGSYSNRSKSDRVDLGDPNTIPRPPWVEGSDADNIPSTRRVQQDIWLHQHPQNCSDPRLKFMWIRWEIQNGLGLGARIKYMLSYLSIAIRENRILVCDSFGRANHDGCEGDRRNQWDCYFLPETSKECKMRALQLKAQPEAWASGIITNHTVYTGWDRWNSPISDKWGSPWEYMQTTAEVGGKLMRHPAVQRRWWRAQAIRYMMRFPSEYTCQLLNKARHQAFGPIAARAMLPMLTSAWPEIVPSDREGEMERIVWRSQTPWIPRPMISMHVRLGDKAREMVLAPYTKYMELASRIRTTFPDATHIWLATEMEDVIRGSRSYSDWNIYYTNISRQTGNTSMADYEGRIGVQASTDNAFANFLMALDSDFFVGPLGSTWSLLIDCMRGTSGKLMSGFLSVNRDTFW